MELITGDLLFDSVKKIGGMGEDVARYLFTQIIQGMDYMQNKGIVHRDLKLENMMINEKGELKIVDFGFATDADIHCLDEYRGTKTYMAPEIKEGLLYDGNKSDVFSAGVILFILTLGIFPFKEAKKDDYFYNLIINRNFEKYW